MGPLLLLIHPNALEHFEESTAVHNLQASHKTEGMYMCSISLRLVLHNQYNQRH